MSKRKTEQDKSGDAIGGVSKKIKTAHAMEAKVPAPKGAQELPNGESEGTAVPRNHPSKEKTKARKERRKARKDSKEEKGLAVSATSTKERRKAKKDSKEKNGLAVSAISTKDREGEVSRKKSKTHKKYKSPGWQISNAVGGCLGDLDPVFSSDEQYLLLAFETSVGVYATSTSLLVRRLSTSNTRGSITGIAMSTINISHLYVCLAQGSIEKWDWTKGLRLGKWAISSQISSLDVVSWNDMQEDLVCVIDCHSGQWMITAHILRAKGDNSNTETHTLLKVTSQATFLKVLQNGKIVVASVGDRLMVGNLFSEGKVPLKDMTYIWREFNCPEWITALDARTSNDHERSIRGGQKVPRLTTTQPIDIVTGGQQGSIFVYRDLLTKLTNMERKKHLPTPAVQNLHWHRNTVGAVKWSVDGNYIISGGVETVMVIWQLDTGQKQFLPHLSAPIESLVVSPSGSSYAVRIADNSTMVLSTVELSATVSIPGIQVPTAKRTTVKIPDLPRISEHTEVFSMSRRSAAAMSKHTPGHLLLSVPGVSSSRASTATVAKSAYLQTFDVKSGSQAARQALTRTKVTDKSMGPESNEIEEPSVVLIQTSHDGQWLATVEEWIPPRRDVQFMAPEKGSIIEEQKSRIEVYLKFWVWLRESKHWELTARIESPHYSTISSPRSLGIVLDLVEDPSSTGFATVGDDGLVKIWRPRSRYRDGVKVYGKDGQPLISWSCNQVIALPTLSGTTLRDDFQIVARQAFSVDGSLLVVGHQSSSGSLLFMINVENGTIRSVRSDIISGSLIGVGIVGRYLIVLANCLTVWDIVDDQLNYEIMLRSHGISTRNQNSIWHLAIDQEARTFAVAIPEFANTKSGTRLRSQVGVFDPAHPKPLFLSDLPRPLRTLLPSMQHGGYLTIDTTAEVRTVARTLQLPVSQDEEKPKSDTLSTLDNIYGNKGAGLLEGTQGGDVNFSKLMIQSKAVSHSSGEDQDRVLVRQQDLTELFDTNHSFALPSVTSIFEQVVGLFSRKLAA